VPVGLVSLYFIWRLLPTVKNPRATRSFDILGGAIFTVAISFLLVGLTQKGQVNPTTHALNDWTEFTVGGFIAIALVGIVLFILAEARAKEPIIPLHLFRNRTFTSSMISTFFASFGFFAAIIFLPRWFQFVEGFSPTFSGLAALPLMVGLIGSSIASGQIVARTGRYKWMIVGALITAGVATLLMTQLRADTPLPMVWLWMFIAGLGVGPTFAVFTIVVQNAVPFHELGVATSSMTFFRQIGGTVALAIVGTIFASDFQQELAPQLTASGVPAQIVTGFTQASSSGALDFNQLTGVGNLGAEILAGVPAQLRPAIEPFLGNIVSGIHSAFSLAVAGTFWIGLGATIIAVLAATGMEELALRQRGTAPSRATAPGRPAVAPD
jgi:Na+/melibiose symporter-like transporter